MADQRPLPFWILIISGLIAVMEFGVSLTMLLAPESMADKVDLTAIGVGFLIRMWATRQLALGVIFAYATFRKSRPMLTLSYLFFLVMFLGDLGIGIVHKDLSLVATACGMCMGAIAMLALLRRK